MTKIFGLLTIFAFVLTSCTGDTGPVGPPGADGEKASTFEESVNFTYDANGNFWTSPPLEYNVPDDGAVFLVYFFQTSNNTFTPMPVSFFDDQGEFQYIFDHDSNSVQLSIIGDSDLSGLDDASTKNVRVRVAIIPGDLIAQFNNSDFSNYKALMNSLDIKESDVQHLNR